MVAKLEHRWVQQRWRTFRCKACTAEFQSSRVDAVCCGPTCRQRWRRMQQQADREMAKERQSAAQVEAIRDKVPDSSPLGTATTAPAAPVEPSRKIAVAAETATINVPTRDDSCPSVTGRRHAEAKPSTSATPRPSPARSKKPKGATKEAVAVVKVLKKLDKLPAKKHAGLLKKKIAKKGGRSK